VIVGMGVIASLLLYIKRHSRPTIPAWTTPADAVGNVENGLAVTQFGQAARAWLQRTNLWRERTNLRTGSQRLRGVANDRRSTEGAVHLLAQRQMFVISAGRSASVWLQVRAWHPRPRMPK
jgi:hypothetical protein